MPGPQLQHPNPAAVPTTDWEGQLHLLSVIPGGAPRRAAGAAGRGGPPHGATHGGLRLHAMSTTDPSMQTRHTPGVAKWMQGRGGG